MSHNLKDADEYTAVVPVPDLNDRTYPTIVPKALQALANRTLYFFNNFKNTELVLDFLTEEDVGTTDEISTFAIPKTERTAVFNAAIGQVAKKIVGLREIISRLQLNVSRPGWFVTPSPDQSISSGNYLTLSKSYDPAVDYSLDGTNTKIKVERAGDYWVDFIVNWNAIAGSATDLSASVTLNASTKAVARTFFSYPSDQTDAGVSGRALVSVVDPGSDLIGIKIGIGTGSGRVSRAYIAITPARVV